MSIPPLENNGSHSFQFTVMVVMLTAIAMDWKYFYL